MAVPDFQTLMLPLLKLAGDGQQHTLAEAVERLAQEFQLSDDDRAQLLQSGQTRLYNRVGWATTYLKKAGLLQAVGPGRFQLTDRGRDVLASRPAAIDVAFPGESVPGDVGVPKGPFKGRSLPTRSRPRPSTLPMAPGTSARASRNGSGRRWNCQFRMR